MLSEVFRGTVNYLQVMNERGEIDSSVFPNDLKDDKIVDMYKMMCFARAFDAKALSLQRQGRTATYGPLVGEEATQIGVAKAMRDNDFFVPNFRQHGVFLARGMPIDRIVLYWKGYEEGNMIPKEVHGFPVIVPVASQVPHAAGIAFAEKHKNTGNAVVAFVGDGGTSEGDFYEAMNFAGVFRLPLVIIVENNQWAISVPRKNQSAAQTLAQKGIAAGINVIQVDGNDVIAVYKATSDAIANSANGPMLIECVTYRMGMHTTADDPTKYRSDAEVDAWKIKDPIARTRAYLMKKGLWNDQLESQMQAEQLKLIDEGVEKAEQFKPDPTSMFKNMYSFMPQVLQDELDDNVKNNWYMEE